MRIGGWGGFLAIRQLGWILLIAAIAMVGPAWGSGPDPVIFREEIRPFLVQHCVKCHGPNKQKGGIDFSKLDDVSSVTRRRKVWRGVIEQVETLEMPPASEPSVTPERRDRVVAWLKGAVSSFDCDDPTTIDPGPLPVRRLTRDEYDRTLRDLLGVDFQSGEVVGMPDDGDGSGSSFSNLAEALILPPVLMEKYFAAADKVLDRVFEQPRHKQDRETLLFARPGLDLSDREAARRVIARFLRLAYRRPVVEAEIARYLTLFDRSKALGASFEESVRRVVKTALISPHFLFRIERDRPDSKEAIDKISDHELAVRLSYFLWARMPDATLDALADQGKLSDPAILEAQVRRMLTNPKARALTDHFAEPWLQIGKLARARPSTEFFPTFTGNLRRSLRDETVTFFDQIRKEDRSILELLDADYAYLNQDLAQHYEIPGVEGPELRRVALPPGSHRGGLLGMGSVLALTSHTDRTSPTLRGKYILEVLFGTPPPPPPADAGKLPEEKAKPGEEPKTFREQMARHARQLDCAGCHAKIDPLGYGLENYDAVGRWRSEQGGKSLDATGNLPGGESFDGADALKRIILARKGDFERNMAERLLAYALGREIQGDDECALRKIQSDLDREGHRFSTLILGVVRSVPFQYRRQTEGNAP